MLYPSPEKSKAMLEILSQRENGEIADEEFDRKILAVDPGNAPDIQRFADEGLDENTLPDVIRFGTACAHIFYAALKEWFFTRGPQTQRIPAMVNP